MLRMLLALPGGVLSVLLLFYLLAMLSLSPQQANRDSSMTPELNFHLLREDPELQLRQRQKPPEPEQIVPQSAPPVPSMDLPQPELDTLAPQVDIPDLMPSQPVLTALAPLAPPQPALYLDSNPTVLSQVPPGYPRRALRRKQEGSVTVEFLVTEAGTVQPDSIKVIRSTPAGVFDDAVLRSIKRWRFKIRRVEGRAVPFKARQELEFKLEK
ncbi:energy transducer TonB [Neptuniibacter halophilus]|uniref:energy transducer TonB n=1 Tax=Neptuniibacter halophilus TaxID=651666 RepID=UPI0025740ADF|nr:energy transducer TonB [Neptuniibacter halophilus]